MKKLLVDGNLGRDAEVKVSKNGRKYVRFSLGTRVFKNGEDDTDWIDVYSFDQTIVEEKYKRLVSGVRVQVMGDFDINANAKNGKFYLNTRVIADFVEILAGKRTEGEVEAHAEKGAEPEQVAQKPAVSAVVSAAASSANADDDLPF